MVRIFGAFLVVIGLALLVASVLQGLNGSRGGDEMAVNNHVQLTGNMAGDVETRRLDGDRVMGKFTIAVDRIGDRKGGTDFIRVVVFGRQAAKTAMYCGKGSKVSVAGRLRTGSYNRTNGDTGEIEKRYTTEVVADQVEFLSPRPTAASMSRHKDAKDKVSTARKEPDGWIPASSRRGA